MGPETIAALAAVNTVYTGNTEPLAFCAIVNKVGVMRDDIVPSSFFYLS